MIREAVVNDIRKIQEVRNSVRENRLSDPRLVTDEDCRLYITGRGRGWVAELDNEIIGFAIVDLLDHNVWALFVRSGFEGLGAGRRLHDTMLNWYFKQSREPLWLSTSPRTRAEQFYRKAGWKEHGMHGKGEIRFEMSFEEWYGRSLE